MTASLEITDNWRAFALRTGEGDDLAAEKTAVEAIQHFGDGIVEFRFCDGPLEATAVFLNHLGELKSSAHRKISLIPPRIKELVDEINSKPEAVDRVRELATEIREHCKWLRPLAQSRLLHEKCVKESGADLFTNRSTIRHFSDDQFDWLFDKMNFTVPPWPVDELLAIDYLWPSPLTQSLVRLWFQTSGAIILQDQILLIRRPRLYFNDSGRLHHSEGFALEYRDGSRLKLIDGVVVSGEFWDDPRNIDPEIILLESNIEVRRTLIELFGIHSFLEQTGAREVAFDDFGTLFHIQKPESEMNPDPDNTLAFVKLLNSTPEPGTTDDFKEYLLRVPPEVTSAHQAVAWSFGLTTEQYQPVIQT